MWIGVVSAALCLAVRCAWRCPSRERGSPPASRIYPPSRDPDHEASRDIKCACWTTGGGGTRPVPALRLGMRRRPVSRKRVAGPLPGSPPGEDRRALAARFPAVELRACTQGGAPAGAAARQSGRWSRTQGQGFLFGRRYLLPAGLRPCPAQPSLTALWTGCRCSFGTVSFTWPGAVCSFRLQLPGRVPRRAHGSRSAPHPPSGSISFPESRSAPRQYPKARTNPSIS